MCIVVSLNTCACIVNFLNSLLFLNISSRSIYRKPNQKFNIVFAPDIDSLYHNAKNKNKIKLWYVKKYYILKNNNC